MIERAEKQLLGRLLSVSNDVNEKSEFVAQLDTMVRGMNGGNGLFGRVKQLEMRLEHSDNDFDDRMTSLMSQQKWIMGLIGSLLVALVVHFLLNNGV